MTCKEDRVVVSGVSLASAKFDEISQSFDHFSQLAEMSQFHGLPAVAFQQNQDIERISSRG